MRKPRVKRGVLVASTNRIRHILSKRLIVEVLYTFKKGIVKQTTIETRKEI